jgi:hypothetical protein
MARGSHRLPTVSSGRAMPYLSMPCRWVTPEMALQCFRGGLRPSSTPLDTPCHTPMNRMIAVRHHVNRFSKRINRFHSIQISISCQKYYRCSRITNCAAPTTYGTPACRLYNLKAVQPAAVHYLLWYPTPYAHPFPIKVTILLHETVEFV